MLVPYSTLTVAAPETVTEYCATSGLLVLVTLEFSRRGGGSAGLPPPPQALRVINKADASVSGTQLKRPRRGKRETFQSLFNSYSRCFLQCEANRLSRKDINPRQGARSAMPTGLLRVEIFEQFAITVRRALLKRSPTFLKRSQSDGPSRES